MEQLESESNNCAPFQKAANLPVERPDNTDFCLKKPSFNIYNFANYLKNKYLALITTRFWPYLVPVPVAVKVEFYGGDSGKPDYRHRSRTGCV